MTLRQIRNRQDGRAPFALSVEVYGFEGSFLSLVIDLPEEASRQISKRHLIRMSTQITMERFTEVFARLSISHGPNTELVVRERPIEGEEAWVEFDLGYTGILEKRVERIWVDLIFKGPRLRVSHLGRDVDAIKLEPLEAGAWQLSVPIPLAALTDGLQTFLIEDADSGETRARFAILAGDVLAEDLRSEIALLRAELDMLKRAFRRHCVETGA